MSISPGFKADGSLAIKGSEAELLPPLEWTSQPTGAEREQLYCSEAARETTGEELYESVRWQGSTPALWHTGVFPPEQNHRFSH